MKNQETQFSRAKTDSIVLAFTISTIISIGLSYVSIGVWWGKLIFEIFSKLLIFLISWKVFADLILRLKVAKWEKDSDNILLKGKWYVIHYSENKRHTNYIRLGSVIIKQKMDEYYLVEGQNFNPENEEKFSSWCGIGSYKLLPELGELSGTFDVVRGDSRVNTDGLHILSVSPERQSMVGAFYNVNCDTKIKPRDGIIKLFKDKDKADAAYQNWLERDKAI